MEERGPEASVVETLVEQARGLDDRDRRALAEARGAIDETFHASAWRAANEAVAERARAFLEARVRIGAAFLPDRLEELIRLGSRADPVELAEWQRIARLVRIGIDDALLALLAVDTIPPPALRELYAPWQAMLAARTERAEAER